MTTRKQQYETMKNERFWKRFYTVMFLLGLVLLLFEISIYRKTIIHIYIPISIILVVGFLTFYFNRPHYKKTYNLTGNFFPIMQNLISWGFISSYLFMATNYYLADTKTTQYRFIIKEKSSIPGRKHHRDERKPLVTIDYFKFEKNLVFPHADTDRVAKAKSVIVTVRKGSLGFDILDHYDVSN